MHSKGFYLLIVATIFITLIALFALYKQTSEDEVINQPTIMNDLINQPVTPTPKPANQLFPEPNQPPYVYVAMGKDWVALNNNWSIRFDSVETDNRCPTGVVCEVSGSAVVKVQFMQPGLANSSVLNEILEVQGLNRFPPTTGALKENLFHPLEINRTDASGNPIGFKITLVDLLPYPDKNHYAVLPDNYVGLFKIEQLK